jgi:hypothetical protein
MNGGMTTGEWGTKAYGGSDSQQAVGNGSNVIRMHDPNSVVAAPQMKGGRRRRYRGGADPVDVAAAAPAGFFADLTGAYDKATEYATGIAAGLTGPATDSAAADNNATVATVTKDAPVTEEASVTEEAATEPVVTKVTEVTGGKGKRKSATKRRKSHKKKGKSSKKRAHKRH